MALNDGAIHDSGQFIPSTLFPETQWLFGLLYCLVMQIKIEIGSYLENE
jgi:hypothetical protein